MGVASYSNVEAGQRTKRSSGYGLSTSPTELPRSQRTATQRQRSVALWPQRAEVPRRGTRYQPRNRLAQTGYPYQVQGLVPSVTYIKCTPDQMREFLLKHKWREDGPPPWQWIQPHYPAAHYNIHDAFELIQRVQKPRKKPCP